MQTINERFRGCLIGGAIGDALGWPVEFLRLDEIKRKYGTQGITNLVKGRSNLVEITDDTQMTIFTAEGLLRAENRGRNKGIAHIPSVVHRSYLRWLNTQGVGNDVEKDGWIHSIKALHTRRAPGNTCLDALISGRMGTMEEPLNNSKGCGGVMRTAPIGLVFKKEEAFKLGCESAAITHGHPSGYLSAGALSYIIAAIIEGINLEIAVEQALEECKKYPSNQECSTLIEKAITLVKSDKPVIQAIESLGEGWVGEEALAISIYSALKYQDDFEKAVFTAVNHNGDSDSTGAITGNILGAYLGINGIPQNWVSDVELSKELSQLADDLVKTYEDSEEWHQKYPGW
ncbi:ADP-ribosylglycohydrolase family protein [Neobacillus sp. YX16]|uniref:ADP-ribosylglycohydrolase family protein n=1 Tax=Neobacillus sp. YX16 TaxID=3047874 RepID=UPI0024C31472|nr:ADP-ribosylglycohydrolase family protein [Neobacillus sp. YX16]WHZ01130.1 ADP-ribosylglycohydrolase family protein [Neobacillus sp. YX16]